MPEQTTPATGVEQAAPDVQTRMQNFLTQFDTDQAEEVEQQSEPEQAKVAEQPQDPATEELTPDDLESDPTPPEQSAVEAFEIVHNGQQKKLSREETIRLAQQGFDYTQKTQALAETQRQVQGRVRMVQEMEQVQPLLAQDLALVASVEAQLKQYQNVDWVKLATEDPQGYPRWRAQYDVIVNNYQQAVGQFQQKRQYVAQRQQALTEQTTQQEALKLRERIPAFRDQAVFEKAARDIREYLVTSGVPEQAVDRMNDSFSVAIAYKAMQYDRLQKAKSEKVKQLRTAPPVTRPGASQGDSAQADKSQALTQRLRKTGDVRDAAALLLNRMK